MDTPDLKQYAIDHVVDGIYWSDAKARILEVNNGACRMVGYSREELTSMTVMQLNPNFAFEKWAAHWELIKAQGSVTFESVHRHKDGRLIAVEITANFIDYNGLELICSFARDISRRKHDQRLLEMMKFSIDNMADKVTWVTSDAKVVYANNAACSSLGYTMAEMLQLSVPDFDPDFSPRDWPIHWKEIRKHGSFTFESRHKSKNGEIHPVEVSVNYMRFGDEEYNCAYVRDISERKKSEELIWRQANFDSLTGLPNREMFRDRLQQEAKKSIRNNVPLALLLVDLDQFKEVNDTLGHAVGDLLLKDAARRISLCVRESDTVARLGGDEFTIVISGISDKAIVEDIAQKIIGNLANAFHLNQEHVFISASIGITFYPNDATDIDVLMKNADQAMYEAKNKGRNRFSYFTPSLQDAAQKRLRLTNDLRGALNAGQFSVHFQPIVALSTGRIHKAEALIRWQHPERGMVSPDEFIPIAEETGLIHEIGDWVFREAARWAKHWRNRYAADLQVSVNKSPVQFKAGHRSLSSRWSEHLLEIGLPGANMVIEITEGLLLNAETEVTDELLRLRDADIQVAIDDFGTGYSSLSYLNKFDIDYLKIDRSFVSNIETDANSMALSEAIIVMAHRLGIKVIAEGVETEGQRDFLALAGCDYAQGYLFSKPVPPEAFENLLISQG